MSTKDVNWLIEDGPFQDNIEDIIAKIEKMGYPLKVIKYKPFESGNYRDLYEEKECVAFLGSINLARQLQRETPWVPGPMTNFDNYKCSVYYAHLGEYLLNSEYLMMPYKEVCRRKKEIATMFRHLHPETSSLFIRPDDGCKTFGGHVAHQEDFDRLDGPVGTYAKPETLTVVASAKLITYEWRVVICDRKAIAASQYMVHNALNISDKVPSVVFEKAEEIANSCEWQPDRMYCLDLCTQFALDVHEYSPFASGIYLLEVNSFCSSGLYACDIETVIEHGSRVAIEEWRDIYEII